MRRRNQEDGRGAGEHFALAKDWIGRRRNCKDRTEAPDQSAGMGGSEKELLGNVADAIRVVVVERTGLTDDGDDGARDKVPVRVQTQWYDGLNVEHFLGAVEGPRVEIRIALERNADKIGDRIL